MNDAAVLQRLARIEQMLARVSRLLEHRAIDPRHAELIAALEGVFGLGAVFSASEVVQAAQSQLSNRRRLHEALAALGAHDAQRLGMVFAAMSKSTNRLQRLGVADGTRLWSVEPDAT